MEDIAKISDKVLVMNHGSLFMFDSAQKVFSNYKKLEEIGLNVPQITKIMFALKEKGLEIKGDFLTVDGAVAALTEYIGGGVNNA